MSSDSDLSASAYQMPRPQLQWGEDGAPFSGEFGDIYFSRGDGLAETEYVFLQQNRLAERWRALDPTRPGVFTIGETGFGTGLNFFCAWQLWRTIAPQNWRLHFVSVEKFPLERVQLERALMQWPQFAELSAQLLEHYPPLVPGHHLRHFSDRITLQLLFGDATTMFDSLHDSAAIELPNRFHIDAWFLDGFAPAKNPAMWCDELFHHIGRLSRANTTFATFTVAGIVKRGLQGAGFRVEKFAGFGAKRQMLRGDFNAPNESTLTAAINKSRAIDYWAYPPASRPSSTESTQPPRIVVIGGGLAGTSSAHALAERGYPVTLLERNGELAGDASGNPQGVLYTKLSAQTSSLNRFALASYLYALNFYAQHLHEHRDVGALCGVLQLAESQQQWQALRTAFVGHDDWVQFVEAAQATLLTNVSLTQSALWFPRAGWLAPARICATLAQHPLIDVQLECAVTAIDRQNGQWHLQTHRGDRHADIVVIANANAARALAPTVELPLKSIRGQITHVPSAYVNHRPTAVLCHEGYVTPAHDGLHIGATFDLRDDDTAVRSDDHRRNLLSLATAMPNLLRGDIDEIVQEPLRGRVGFRCTTPDYLPIVGAVADAAALRDDFAALAKNANARTQRPGTYWPGLYVNVGHGSRGLTSTPLCAQLLAALIVDEARPLPRELVQALSPARFCVRAIIRGRQC